jgi:hypothetical protein
MKTFLKKHIFLLVGILVIVIAGWLIKNQNSKSPVNSNLTPTNESLKPSTPTSQNISGLLKLSDNTQRGNLMLETAKEKIYLFTGRDYSKLLNTQVVLKINGTLENFSLIDITAK